MRGLDGMHPAKRLVWHRRLVYNTARRRELLVGHTEQQLEEGVGGCIRVRKPGHRPVNVFAAGHLGEGVSYRILFLLSCVHHQDYFFFHPKGLHLNGFIMEPGGFGPFANANE